MNEKLRKIRKARKLALAEYDRRMAELLERVEDIARLNKPNSENKQ